MFKDRIKFAVFTHASKSLKFMVQSKFNLYSKSRPELSPKKYLGQHFLRSQGFLDKIIKAAEISLSDTVLEVGAGSGGLSEKIAPLAGKVILVEKDERFVEYLEEKFKTSQNLTIVHQDILKLNPRAFNLEKGGYIVLGNLPYYLTSRLFRKIFETWPRPKRIVFMVQKEVAQRILAKPPEMNLLALSVQYFSRPEVLTLVPKEAFWPRPQVDSAIIILIPHLKIESGTGPLFKLIRAGFLHKRKLLSSNLASELRISPRFIQKALERISLVQTIRAQELSLAQWKELRRVVDKLDNIKTQVMYN